MPGQFINTGVSEGAGKVSFKNTNDTGNLTFRALTAVANISATQNIACSGGGVNITISFSDTGLCDSNTIYGDFTGLFVMYVQIGGQVREYVNVGNVSAIAQGLCVTCP